MDTKKTDKSRMNRRGFLATTAAAGATVVLARGAKSARGEAAAPAAKPKPRAPKADDLNVGIIGVGAEGFVLLNACLKASSKIPGLRFKAVCDIWEYKREWARRWLRARKHDVKTFENYKDMLADPKLDLDCLIVATPDWMHAEQAIAGLEKGLDVYCEKEMSNSLEKAKSMVVAAAKTGKLLQIGHQRRSNPRYIKAIEGLVLNKDIRILGRVSQAFAQWNRSVSADIGWPKKGAKPWDAALFAKYGYDSPLKFLNWRWYKKYGGGPIVDLGSHQIDIFEWVFGTTPQSVVASGGVDYYPHHEWYDNVMCFYEYKTAEGMARAFYQVQTTTSHGGYHEVFMGENGTLAISENPATGNWVEREKHGGVPPWNPYVKAGLLQEIAAKISSGPKPKNAVLDVRLSPSLPKWPLPTDLAKPFHQPHLENFFEAVRLGNKEHLNCPAEIGYKTAVATLAVNDAVESQQKRIFDKKEFDA